MGRLRRLDALFAEKVLGCAIRRGELGGVGCGCESEAHTTDGGIALPSYTRSLDAAWEGIHVLRHGDQLNAFHVTFCSAGNEHEWGDQNIIHMSRKGWDVATDLDADGYLFNGDDCQHPAEALVLAVLRAVGCSEEELA